MRTAREKSAPREPGISRLARIPTRECGEPLVDLCEECPVITVTACPTYARRSIAAMLNRAQAALPPGIRLKVHTALRTTEMQANGYWNHYKSLQEKHPSWPKAILRREANKFWHPPDVSKAPPGHCTGGAVDVGLLDEEGAVVDVTSVTEEGISSQATYALGLTPQAKANRDLLIRAMTDAGFSNCYDEWWHWSYGDCGWAARLDRPEAIYGWVTDLPEGVIRQVEEKKRQDEEKRKEDEEKRREEERRQQDEPES